LSDQVVALLIATGVATGIALIIYFLTKFQQALAGKQIDEIELADNAIEKKIDSMSIDDIIKLNNDDKGSSSK
jgi:hypothetical protein